MHKRMAVQGREDEDGQEGCRHTGQSLNLDNKIRICKFSVNITKRGANFCRKTWKEIGFSA